MVCVPCLVVPFLLWVFHRFFLPLLLPFFPSLQAKLGQAPSVEATEVNTLSCPTHSAEHSDSSPTESKKDL
ncbi:hypothetical protein ECG_09043 [Echinococcus granulosus]|uniref:Expressed protein n=1 Tax=Echinococcus granulosus TaxID=6210 RepID=U6JFX7_ECHGR|nr:hypothetical protein EGR_10150 [Echinococcus granulosus]EUB54986.1 hypothetical protein EGR_10150 [Echinococcus granulosus]KAH9278201.1 hypothetical protein ECG_09043 [Echinococcus granulosus]CDS21356.1 expressed protein [Echinococcus granulosus]